MCIVYNTIIMYFMGIAQMKSLFNIISNLVIATYQR